MIPTMKILKFKNLKAIFLASFLICKDKLEIIFINLSINKYIKNIFSIKM